MNRARLKRHVLFGEDVPFILQAAFKTVSQSFFYP